MIKTILVPATGSDMDIAVFRSALTVARAFAAHLEFLHVHVDAMAMAATAVSHGGVGDGAMISRLADQLEEDAGRLEAKARQSFQEFCAREQLVLGIPRSHKGFLQRNGSGKPATKPTGLRSWDAQLTSSLSDVGQTIRGYQLIQ
jgi:hypothetical protein